MDIDEQKRLQKHFFDEILLNGVNLTDWEEKFMESVEPRVLSNWALSRAQFDTLEAIYTRRVP